MLDQTGVVNVERATATATDAIRLDDNSKVADASRICPTHRACAFGHLDAAQCESWESLVKATLMRSKPLADGAAAEGSGQSKLHVWVGRSARLISADAALELRAWLGSRLSFGHLDSLAATST